MARTNSNSLLNSLKGKIWLAAMALAFFTCTFGLISYLIVSFVVTDPFFAVFIPFLFLAFTVMGFGWWLSTEVVAPIEKVTLLARSLERSSSTTLPKTSGSSETDELLRTLHRHSVQMQKVVSLMDEVASGNIDVALTPIQNSDRLTAAFQKVLGKVADSIIARKKLQILERAVVQITDQVTRIRKYNLDAEITTDYKETKEIAETLKFLVAHLNEMVVMVRSDAGRMRESTSDVSAVLQELIHLDENRVQEMNQAAFTLQEIPFTVQKIAENVAVAVQSANQSIEKAREGTATAEENVQATAALRKQLQEAVSRLGKLNERATEIGKIAKSVGDFAHRTNTVALNASIQAGELGEHGRGFGFVAEEIGRLATRAENTNREINSLNKTISGEIEEVEKSLRRTVQEAAELSKYAVETGTALSELEKHISQVLSLQDQLNTDSSARALEAEKAFQIFVGSIAETEHSIEALKLSEKSVTVVSMTLENMLLSVEDFNLPQESADNDFEKLPEFDAGTDNEPLELGSEPLGYGEDVFDAESEKVLLLEES